MDADPATVGCTPSGPSSRGCSLNHEYRSGPGIRWLFAVSRSMTSFSARICPSCGPLLAYGIWATIGSPPTAITRSMMTCRCCS